MWVGNALAAEHDKLPEAAAGAMHSDGSKQTVSLMGFGDSPSLE